MSTTDRIQPKQGLPLAIALVITLIGSPDRALAQDPWPPFWFDLSPSAYQGGKITYRLELYSRVTWSMPGLTIKVPLPAGTRFLGADADPGVAAGCDGREVTFQASTPARYIEQASFTVEVTDPQATVFTTRGWISWGGDHPGDYLAEEVSFNVTQNR